MKKLFVLIIGLTLFSMFSFGQYKLDIEIAEIKNNTGKIMLQLFDANEKVINQEVGVITDKKSSVAFTNLKPGKYAIRYFHDENNNGELDTNMFGIPKEGYGFSNNAKGKFGPPPFEKWLFDLTTDKKIVLTPMY